MKDQYLSNGWNNSLTVVLGLAVLAFAVVASRSESNVLMKLPLPAAGQERDLLRDEGLWS